MITSTESTIVHNKRRSGWLVAVLLVLSILATIWSYQSMIVAKRRATVLANEMAKCESLARQINASSSSPHLAESAERDHLRLVELIEASANKAGIAKLDRIDPEYPRRIGRSPYLEKPTSFAFADGTLDQLMKLLHELSGQEHQLRIKSLNLKAPHNQIVGSKWHVDVTTTYLIYEPVTRQ